MHLFGMIRRSTKLLCAVLFGCCAATAIHAQPRTETVSYNFVKGGQQLGLRLGLWANQGEQAPSTATGTNNEFLETNLTESSFMLELFYAWRFARHFGLELSGGVVNRGDITYTDRFADRFYGNLILYPIMAKARAYLAPPGFRLQPYLLAGGGIIHGRNDIQLTTSPFYFEESSETDFNFTFGGGFDYGISKEIALNVHSTFTPVSFGNSLALASSYDGLSITVGVSYLMAPGKKGNKRPPRRY